MVAIIKFTYIISFQLSVAVKNLGSFSVSPFLSWETLSKGLTSPRPPRHIWNLDSAVGSCIRAQQMWTIIIHLWHQPHKTTEQTNWSLTNSVTVHSGAVTSLFSQGSIIRELALQLLYRGVRTISYYYSHFHRWEGWGSKRGKGIGFKSQLGHEIAVRSWAADLISPKCNFLICKWWLNGQAWWGCYNDGIRSRN